MNKKVATHIVGCVAGCLIGIVGSLTVMHFFGLWGQVVWLVFLLGAYVETKQHYQRTTRNG